MNVCHFYLWTEGAVRDEGRTSNPISFKHFSIYWDCVATSSNISKIITDLLLTNHKVLDEETKSCV